MILNNAFKCKTVFSDQDKIIPPEETVKQFKERLQKTNLDILKETKRIDNGRLDIPVYFSTYGKDGIAATGGKKQMGKGATAAQAEASAVMELAERFSFFSFCKNNANFFYAKYEDIKDKALNFELLAKSVNDNSAYIEVAEKIYRNLDLKWTKAFNLTENKDIHIPFDWFFAINQFNGACAGNCNEEAVCQGICEIVERHVSELISGNKIKPAEINPASVTYKPALEILEKYRKAGIKIHISDFSLNAGIPTIGVLAYDPATFPEKSEIVWTAGTSPDPQKALCRALTETAQLGGDFNTGSNYLASGLPKFSDINQADFIINSGKKININLLSDISDNNILNEIKNCVSALRKKNMPVIAVDTTHPVLKIPAFYVIVPGTRFRERAGATQAAMFLAKLTVENKEPQAAAEELKKIDKTLRKKYYIKFYLGYAYLCAQNPVKALEYFKTSLELDPPKEDKVSVYSYIGVCLKDTQQYDKALEYLKKGAELDNERTDIYNLMGFCCFKLKKHKEAISCFKEIIRLDPSSAIDYANIGSNYRELGDTEKAVEYYQAALALDPSIDFALENLIKIKTNST